MTTTLPVRLAKRFFLSQSLTVTVNRRTTSLHTIIIKA